MYKPKKYDEVKKELNQFITLVTYDENIYEPSVAYCYRDENNFSGVFYNFFVNNKDEELKNFLFMHEAGHLIFGHILKENTSSQNVFSPKIHLCFDQLRKWFENMSEQDAYDYFQKFLFNLVFDWEVNSKLFDEQEIEIFTESFHRFEIANNLVKADDLETLKSHKPQMPGDYNFPSGLTANEYLSLILQNPEEFFKNVAKNNSSSDGSDSDGSSSDGSSSDGSDSDGSSSNGKLTKQDIEKIVDAVKKSGDQKRKIEKMAREKKASQGFDREKYEGSKLSLDQEVSWKDYDGLEKNILNCLLKSNVKNERRDLMYYYNRGKYNSDVCYSKNRTLKKYLTSSLTVLLDVSGSIEEEDIIAFCNIFRNIANRIHKKCEIILWDTELRSRFYSDQVFEIVSGGGTDIGKGLEYLASQKLLPNTTVFVVSDFEDCLGDWIGKLNKKMYGVCWSSKREIENRLSPELSKKFFNMFSKILIKNENLQK